MKFSKKLLLLFFLCLQKAETLKSVTSSTAMSADINTAVLDEGTGTYYVGTAWVTGLTLAKYAPVTGSTVPAAATVHADAANKPFKYLTVSVPGTTTTSARIAGASYDGSGGVYNRIVVTDGTTYTKTGIINDVVGDVLTYIPDTSSYVSDGSDDGEVLALAADSTRVFAVVRRASGDWLTPGSGINSYTINSTTLALTQKDQQTMDSQDFLVGSNSNGVDDAHEDNVIIRYDSDLNMVYVANYWTRANSASSDGVHSIAAYSVNTSTGVLTATNLHGNSNTATSSGWGDASSDANKHIIGVVGGGSATLRTVAAHAFDIMSTSTSLKYMIIAGGNGTNATTGNTVWALPLVTTGQTNAGTLADTTGTNLNTQAADATKLYNAGSIPAKVGNGVLPWAATVIPSAMQVIGDTVYITTDDNTGSFAAIYYSKAIFDGNNMIASWTPWKKAGPKELGTSGTDGSIINFAVNPITGKIWSVPEDSNRVVRTTAWAAVGSSTTTTTQLADSKFTGGQRHSGQFYKDEHNLPKHISMHAGCLATGVEGVVFVRHDEADSTATDGTNVLSTSLPSNTHYILSTGMSAWSNGTDLVMIPLVGTQDGLYAFIHATDKTGGNPTASTGDFDDFTGTFWTTNGTWERVQTNVIKGNVVRIISSGNGLYIHTRGISTTEITDTLWRLDRTDVTTNKITGATPVKVAETNRHGLPNLIFDIGLITSGATGAVEQVYLGTTNGLITSNNSGGVQAIAETSFAASSWTTISGTSGETHITVNSEGNELSSHILSDTSSVTSTSYKITHDGNGIPTPAKHTEHSVGTLSESHISASTGKARLTDGARDFFIETGSLTARKHGTTTPLTPVLSEETAIFAGKQPQHISLIPSGIIQVATNSGTIELK